MVGEPELACLDEDAVGNLRPHRLEDLQPVGRAGQRIDRVLGVGHQAEHVAGFVADAGDVVLGSVRVLARRVAQDDMTGSGV